MLESHSLTFGIVFTLCAMCGYVFVFNVPFEVPDQTIVLCSR